MQARRGPAVVHVADYAATYSGTFIASLRALAGPARRMGLRTAFALSRDVAAYAWTDELRRDGFPVHFLDPAASLPDRASALGEIAAREEAAIVHAHFGVYDVPAALAALRARHRYEVVWHRHNGFPPRRSLSSSVKDAIKMRVLGPRTWMIAVSAAMRDEALAHGFPARRAFLVENGVDLARVTAPSAPRDALRRRFGLGPSSRVVLLFGWDPARKGVDLALDAVARVTRREPEAVLLLVGGEALHAFVRARMARIPPHVRMVPPQENVADVFAVADVFVSASRDEGFSYALGEALANGLPCVVSDIAAVRWALEGGAAFCPADDVEALTETIERALRLAPAEREDLERRGRAFASARLSLARWASRVVSVYRVACRRPHLVEEALDGAVLDGGAAP